MLVSSRYIHDLSNSCIKNLDYTLVFKSFNREKLLVLFEALHLSIDVEVFKELYLDATAEPFNFYMLIAEIIHMEEILTANTY